MSDAESSAFLNPWQRRVAAGALTALGLAVILLALTGLFFLLRGFVIFFATVIWPLAIAGILALILRPVVAFIEARLRTNRLVAIALLYALGVGALLGVFAFFTPLLVRQALDLIQILPELLRNAHAFLVERYPEATAMLADHLTPEQLEDYGRQLAGHLQELASFTFPAVQQLGAWLASLGAWVIAVGVIPIYLLFFLLTRRDPTGDMKEQLSFLNQGYRDDAIFLIKEFARIMEAFFRGQIVIALIMGVLFAIGFTLIGLDFAIVLGLSLGALNIIPYLGTIIGLILCLPIAYLQPDGGLTLLALALAVFVAVQLLESYLLTHRIMGRRTGLHPLAIIVAIFFWGTALGGILGMILAIPLTAFFVVTWRLVRKKYLNVESSRD